MIYPVTLTYQDAIYTLTMKKRTNHTLNFTFGLSWKHVFSLMVYSPWTTLKTISSGCSTCFQLKPNVKFSIVVYIGTEAGNEHYSHIVIDIMKGTCETIMDPHADAHMDCIYFEVCNCMGSGVADIV